MQPEDLDHWYVRNNSGTMVPFSAFASGHWSFGSPRLERYNGIPSMEILGQAAPGKFRRCHEDHGGDGRETSRRHRV